LEISILEIRSLIANEIINNRNNYADFITDPFEQFVTNIKKDRNWAIEVEIAAAENVFKRPIVVYYSDGNIRRRSELSEINTKKGDDGLENEDTGLFRSTTISYSISPITLLYSGEEIFSGHYNVLLKV
jgi:hypothetical protein